MCFEISAVEVIYNSFKALCKSSVAVFALIKKLQLLRTCAVKDSVYGFRAEICDRLVQIKTVLFGKSVKIHLGNAVALYAVPAVCNNCAFGYGKASVRDYKLRVDLHLSSQTCAERAGAVRVIEGEKAGAQLVYAYSAVIAGIVLGEHKLPLLAHYIHNNYAAGELARSFDGVGKAADNVALYHKAVNNYFNSVLFILIKLYLFAEFVADAVNSRSNIAALSGVLKNLAVLALSSANNGGKDLDTAAFGQKHNLINNLVNCLLSDLLAALWAMRSAYSRPEKTEIIVNLRYRANCGAGVLAGCLLVNAYSGRKTLDIVHIGFFLLTEEHSGI